MVDQVDIKWWSSPLCAARCSHGKAHCWGHLPFSHVFTSQLRSFAASHSLCNLTTFSQLIGRRRLQQGLRQWPSQRAVLLHTLNISCTITLYLFTHFTLFLLASDWLATKWNILIMSNESIEKGRELATLSSWLCVFFAVCVRWHFIGLLQQLCVNAVIIVNSSRMTCSACKLGVCKVAVSSLFGYRIPVPVQ